MNDHSQAARVYEALLERAGEAHPRPRIEPVRRLAELAGSPQLSYPVIQVAGTNGKTSTSRAIESLLRAHGLRTGLFTSPHLVDFRERFQIDGEPITAAALAESWEALQSPLAVVDQELQAAGHGAITFFEALVVLALLSFADAPVDVAVLEVGIGGEWDATNIVDARVAVFTPIDLDHTAILGHTIAEISRTKAGIIKSGSVVVTATQDEDALTELQLAASEHSCPVFVADSDFALLDDRLAVGGRQITVRGITGHPYDAVFLPLYGSHQAENAAVAVAAVEAFLGGERPIPEEVYEEGLAQVTSPGRLQLVGTSPSVYVDAAHNPHGAEALARAVTESFSFSALALVLGALADKDAAGVLAALSPVSDFTVLTPVASERSLTRAPLQELAEELLTEHRVDYADSLPEALERARAWAQQAEGRGVLVAGSVVLAGEAIAYAQSADWGTA